MVSVIHLVFQVLELFVLIHVLLSWVPVLDRQHPVVKFIDSVVNPILAPFRRLLWPLTKQIGIDISPILLFFVLGFVERVVISLIIA
ncbi:MAG: YggT family protein [Armatimonadetes bacterium]|nr:YggT family protein [Armatimonadota bacterium]